MQNFYANPAKFMIVIFLTFLLFVVGCGKSPEMENYENCLPLLNEERKKARDGQNYSYDSERFLECRAPVQYGS